MSTGRADVAMAFRRCVALGDQSDLATASETWSAFGDLAADELDTPTPFTDVTGLARMYASARLSEADFRELDGDLAGAESARDAAMEVMQRHGGDADQIEVRRQRANTLKTQARFAEALTELQAVVAESRLTGGSLEVARSALDLAMLLEWLGDFQRASTALTQAAEAVDSELDGLAPATDRLTTLLSVFTGAADAERTTALQSIRMELGSTRGMIAKRLGDYDTAFDHFQSVHDDYEHWGTGAAIRFHLAHLELLAGRPEAAVESVRTLRPEFEAHAGLATKLSALTWIESEASLPSDPSNALQLADDAYRNLRARGDLELAWKARTTCARALAAQQRHDAACEAYVEAATIVDGLRRIPVGYRLESTYFADRRPMFDEAIQLAATAGRAGDCWRLIDLAKSRSFATLLYGDRRPAPESEPAQRFDELSRRIDALDYHAFATGDGKPAERDQLVAERAELIELIRVSDPRWRAMSQPATLDDASIRSALGDAAALTVHLAGSTITSVLITGERAVAASHTLDRTTQRALRDHRRTVQGISNPPGYDFSEWHELGLDAIVGAEMAGRLVAEPRIAIAPHGLLHLVPWATLNVDGHRWYEATVTTLIPNVASLPALTTPPRDTHASATVIEAPDYSALNLSAIGGEHDIVAKHYGSRATAVPGGHATEAAVRSALTTASDVLHISCHGVIDDIDPSSSALLAADGRVDAAELAMAHIAATDVVLAACSTGYRPERVGSLDLVGDDIVGLPAAVLEGGAATVLVSIPKASDTATIDVMDHFHQHRSTGQHPADALRAAQQAIADDHPTWSWCGFALYGHPGGST